MTICDYMVLSENARSLDEWWKNNISENQHMSVSVALPDLWGTRFHPAHANVGSISNLEIRGQHWAQLKSCSGAGTISKPWRLESWCWPCRACRLVGHHFFNLPFCLTKKYKKHVMNMDKWKIPPTVQLQRRALSQWALIYSTHNWLHIQAGSLLHHAFDLLNRRDPLWSSPVYRHFHEPARGCAGFSFRWRT